MRFGSEPALAAEEAEQARADGDSSTAITQNAAAVPLPGKSTFMPKTLAISVSGSRIALKTVSTRRTSFWRCEITDSFVDSSASTTSL